MKINSFIAVLFLLLCVIGNNANANGFTHTIRTKDFLIFHDNTHPYLARVTGDIAEEQLAYVAKELGYTQEQFHPFKLYAFVTHYSFMNSAASDGFDRYTVGLANSKDQSISVDASSSLVDLQEVLTHELTHAVLFRLVRDPNTLPLWFHEGLSKVLSEENGAARDKKSITDNGGEILFLKSLKYKFPENKKALAYAESGMSVRILLGMAKKNGYTAKDIVNITSNTDSFDAALKKTIHMDESSFENLCTRKLIKEYAILNISNILAAALGVIMAILVIIAFFVRRKQKLLAAKRWEAEEWQNNDYPTIYDYYE